MDRAWFGGALLAAALAQAVSVYRWESIARIFGLRVQTRALALGYAQGMTLNVLLPGATLGGDALRSLRLQALGNPLGVSALTVLLDRLSGLWVLCVLSLLTGAAIGVALLLQGPAGNAPPVAQVLAQALPAVVRVLGAGGGLLAYLVGLALLCAVPWLPLRPRRRAAGAPGGAPGYAGIAARLWNRLCGLHDLAQAERRPLARSLWSSLAVQLLCALTLWLCALAAGGRPAYWQVQAVAAPVFIAAALPLSYGGFGARELMALVAFPLAGLSPELGLAASVLYGIVGVVLGLLAAPAFVLHRPAPRGAGAAPAGDAARKEA